MAENLRVFLATIIFLLSGFCILDLFLSGFDFSLLFFALIGFCLAHLVWPKERRNNKNEEDWVDHLGDLIDLPYRAIARILRSIGNSRDGDSGFDFD